MDTLALGSTGRRTTRLGFGCGSVMGVLGWTDSMRMLEAAFDAGIRHFDVAPAYGYGEAERCLGVFLSRHAGQVTVASKFGIPAAKAASLKGVARRVARPLLKALPGLKTWLPGVASAVSKTETFVQGPNPIFTTEHARRSIDNSLAALKVDHLDLLLLHEARSIDLNDDSMLRFFEDMVRSGKVGSFGVGSEGWKIPALLAQKAAYCRVLQYEWSVLDPVPPYEKAFRIHHRSLTRHFHMLHEAVLSEPDRRRRWSEACGTDVGDSVVLAKLMLKAAMLVNPKSVILFSSKRSANVTQNVRTASSSDIDDQARRFYAVVQADQACQLPASRMRADVWRPLRGKALETSR